MQIEAENLGKRFNREWIFRNFSYTFTSGKHYAILGPNGSGKSTMLQTLWGQMIPSMGQLRYRQNGRTMAPEDCHRSIAIATPYMELIDEFTLTEMVNFHFRFKALLEVSTPDDAIERMELSHARYKSISQFSSGMRQRLKLGLAFYSKVDVLFLDEPTTNLDADATGWYRAHLAKVSNQIVFIASNQAHEYPETAEKINITAYK